MPTLDDILERLERYRQRARFTAVSGLLGVNPFTMFQGYPRNYRTCWVVAKDTGLPTTFSPEQCHPDLGKNTHIIETADELSQWLATNP